MKMKRVIWQAGLLLALVVGLVACGEGPAAEEIETTSSAPTATTAVPTATATSVPSPTPAPTAAPPAVGGWWNETVFYEIFVRSFYDSDGDGIGDIQGLIARLDYLNDGDPATSDDLGVTGIWLMPVAASPSYHGYDVVDYYTIDPDYGTNEDFRELIDAAHRRGIKVIVDLVLNHTSSEHPWFEDAMLDENSPYRDYYIWSEEDPGFPSPWGGDAWHRSPTGYYYGVFWEGMPDLNYANPEVTAEMEEATRFWLEEMGVDGFRLDAIKHIFEEGRTLENLPATHEWLEDYHAFYKEVAPDAFTVGEAWTETDEVVAYVGDEVDIAFEFDLAEAMLASANRENKRQVTIGHAVATDAFPPQQFATFLTNHDQPRVMEVLDGNVEQAKTAASLLLTGPGVPFIYYGEEIGHVGGKPDENIRTPLQWSDAENAGFTNGRPWRPPQDNFETVNIAAQEDDPDSLLSHYRRLIHARNGSRALQFGAWHRVESDDGAVYAFLRTTDAETMLVVINLSGETIADYTLELDAGPLQTGEAAEVLMETAVSSPDLNDDGGFNAYTPLQLAPYSTYIISLN